MKKIYWIAVAFILLPCAAARAYDNGDFQIWHTEEQGAKIARGAKMTAEEEFRFGEDAGELYYQHYDFGAVFGFDRMLDIGLNYRQVYEKKKHKWMEENRPHVNAAVKIDLWKFRFEDRSRIEYRHFRYRKDFIRYRNKFALKLPLDFEKIRIQPYASDEFFISSDGTGLNENRIYAGVELEAAKYLKLDVYYLFKVNRVKGNKWSYANVLGTKVKIAF